MTSVNIGNGLTGIGEYTFSGCSSLTSLAIGSGVNMVGIYAFSGCSSLPSVAIPNSVNSIGNYAFSGCSALRNVIMEDKASELVLGSNGSSPLFSDCPLDTVYIGRNITYPTSSGNGYSPFYRNTSLRFIHISDVESEISPYEFYGCTNLKNVLLDDGVQIIGSWAFSGCTSLDYFRFGTNMKSIGKEAFSDCIAMTMLYGMAPVPPTCGEQALDDINKWECTLIVPNGYVAAYQAASQWREFFFINEGAVETGDVNGDERITSEDIALLVDIILGNRNGDTSVADVNGDGQLTVADVTALVNMAATGSTSTMVTGITLNTSSLSLNSGDVARLTAIVAPSTALDKSVTWSSSDTSVATVGANGTVTAVAGGTCAITCEAADGSGVKATCQVTVTQLVTSITLSQTTLALGVDGYKKLTATVLPSNAANKQVTWSSSNTAVAEVTSSGGVAANGPGTCTITCAAKDGSGVKATCTVTVTQLVTSITLSQSALSLVTGGSQTLTATVLPSNAANMNVTWSSSNTAVTTVNANGLVTAVSGGTCTITCEAADGSGVTATCTVTVTQGVTRITLSQTSLTFDLDDENYTQTLMATVLPSEAANKTVNWSSSNTNVATIDQTGLVTAIAKGTCTITVSATDGSGVYATCTVRVERHEYVDLGLPSGTLWATCNIGAENPEDYGDYFAWGETTGYKNGKTNFTWSTYKWCNGSESTLTKYCNKSSYGYSGFTDTLTELEPEDDAAYVNWGANWRMPSKAQFEELINSSYTTTTWTTQNGVYGRKITSKSNSNSLFLPAAGYRYDTSLSDTGSFGYYWTRTLYTSRPSRAYNLGFYSGSVFWIYYDRIDGPSVRPVRVSVVASITLSHTSLSLNSGDTQTLTATVQPSNASDKGVTWSSSNTAVATVNQSGLVTAIAGGTCTITCAAKDGSGVTATCTVTVTQLVTSITLNQTTLSLVTGGSQTLTATVSPSNANNKGVTWTSSDESVAEVTSNGLVSAIGLGTCTITCTAKDGSGVSATCLVTVVVDNSGSIDGRDYVDLVLPSGTLWATCNIGADNPEDYGLYFAWGETTGYTQDTSDGHSFDWTSYKYAIDSGYTLTKYCNKSYNGFTDTLTELVPEDDAAYVNWGANWRMPSYDQISELYNRSYTTTTWTTQNGVNGWKITSKSNGNSLFLPAAGFRYDSTLGDVGSHGDYWSRTLNAFLPDFAYYLGFYSDGEDYCSYYRCRGQSVRPVRSPQ